jgi:hypothetical protein
MHSGTFNVVFKTTPSPGSVDGYLVGGPGFYHRSVSITTPETGIIRVCSPYLFVCLPGSVSVDQVLATRSSTDFGFNVGGGITFSKFYLEIRYHYTRGPEFDVPANLPEATVPSGKVRASGHYFPIIVGYRF